jgi:hypothetical protein
MGGFDMPRMRSLIRPELFPVPSEKFPVIVFREMTTYPLIFMPKSCV